MSKGKKLTDEEKKERKRLYDKAYREANKERIKEKKRLYQIKTKDKKRAYDKKYNKENKDKRRLYNKVNKEANKLPYNVVYCIPNYNGNGDNYCGVTNQPVLRMRGHKSVGKLNTSEWYELGRVEDRKEAETLESSFHKLGYHGEHKMRGKNKNNN